MPGKRPASGDPQVHVETRAAWRDWLVSHHDAGLGAAAAPTGVWAVTWRKPTGKPAPSYDDLVEEALCVGWVDSIARKLDDERTMLRFSPRKPGSGWSRPNKLRVERLEAAGLMLAAGKAAVARAVADGTWTMLDAVEDLVVPDDLAAALEARPPAAEEFDAFPRSVRRGILEWIVQAKRPATRERRVQETAERAQAGERANQWRQPGG